MTLERTAISDGRSLTTAVVGSFEVNRLDFPPSYRHGAVDPERGYVVLVLDGAVCKTFAGDSAPLARDSVATIPPGSKHSSEFSPTGASVLVVRSAGVEPSPLFGTLLVRRRDFRASASTGLGWRMAAELEARDPSWALALEGLVLQFLATAERAGHERRERGTAWLRTVRDLVEEHLPDHPSLTDLAAAVGRHPTHVARAFRREYGVTISEHARSLRLDWAAAQLALDDAPLARIAADAGFADQSHFTRAFRRHTGVTPGRYRALVRS